MQDFVAKVTLQDVALVVVLVLAVAGAIVGITKGGETQKAPARQLALQRPAAHQVPVSEFIPAASTPPRQSEAERAAEIIAEHESKVEEAPESEEAPALLCAAGNLYRRKLGDYDEAIRTYEVLLHDYPDWEGILRVYLNLAACYEQVGNDDGATWVYRKMTERFPEGSPEHQYARIQLGYQ
ncbi:MAG TPA: tetratricopeptide repeat protein [Candidatus Hydrogenedentes bacterium]|nr:tetratricopeptide repeat protein [Candidatus Hydrogenedentota bacterium]HPG66573.1 tetratricopeptide repeat protein [Candidatus Hydrogenedentota bacterium]